MRLAAASDIRRIDDRAEKEFGIPRIILMENAGSSIVLAMERVLGSLQGKRVTVFCGKGGNGGDGMCAARHLISHGVSVAVGLVGKRAELKGETQANCAILERMGILPQEISGAADMAWVRAAAGAADYVIDALLGIGASLPLSGTTEEVAKAINDSGRPVVCADIPSGVDADSGAVKGTCVRAFLTVTFGLPKRGLVLHPGTAYAGKLVVADLTCPMQLLTDPAIGTDILLQEEAAELLPRRRPQAHKHEVGRALIVAGSRAMTGAALLAGEGALAAGAGLVYLALPAKAAELLHGRRPEIIIRPMPQTDAGGIAREAAKELAEQAGTVQAMALGPGVGLEEDQKSAMLELLRNAPCPVVADADALTALAGEPQALDKAAGPRVLTPHAGEMGYLLGTSAAEIEADRLGAAQRAAAKFHSVVVLKGARTAVAEPGGRVFLIPTGNPGMASGGTGDVLTGLLAGLLAQRLPPVSAALLGAYVHGLAGDLARDDKTELSLTASDVAFCLPRAFSKLAAGESREGALAEDLKGGGGKK